MSFLEDTLAVELPLDQFVPENFATPAPILAMLERLRPTAIDDVGEEARVAAAAL